jgi:uroporphyrinogen III methyltransferase/synthase
MCLRVRFEVVPGVCSEFAVPSYAGIPLTHRGLASSFAVLTGHEDPSKDADETDWGRLATAVETLVILMAVGSFPRIVGALLANGRPPETPVALIRWGTTEAQEVRVGTLADIVGRARGLEPPVVAVIGEVVALRERLAWSVEAATATAI